MKTKHLQDGFALLLSMIIIGTILLIGVSLLDVTIKQVRLTTNAKQSELAFQAANAGMECARDERNKKADQMEVGAAVVPSCFHPTNTLSSYSNSTILNNAGNGAIHLYEYDFTWGSGIETKCTEITTLVAVTDVAGSGISMPAATVQTYIPGYPDIEGDFDCASGARCTLISTKGFNTSCDSKGGYGVVQREVLLEF